MRLIIGASLFANGKYAEIAAFYSEISTSSGRQLGVAHHKAPIPPSQNCGPKIRKR